MQVCGCGYGNNSNVLQTRHLSLLKPGNHQGKSALEGQLTGIVKTEQRALNLIASMLM